LSPVAIPEAAAMLASFLKHGTLTCPDGLGVAETLKLLIEDLRTYYYEAAAARPGNPDSTAIQNWFWRDTAAGRFFLALHRSCLASPDKSLQQLCATSLVPRANMVELSK
jgi:hypothetical protein